MTFSLPAPWKVMGGSRTSILQKEEDVAQESRNAAQGRSAGNGQISGERRFIHPRMTTVLLPCPDGSPRTVTSRRSVSKEKVII